VVDPQFVIPAERLPPGFAQSVEQPPGQPAAAKPAATIVLLRDGAAGMEVLLLKRHRASGFVPGAYVFPGGRTDAPDADPELARLALNFHDAGVPGFYWFAAVREAFEETGVLLGRNHADEWVPDATASDAMQALRVDLLEERASLREVLETCRCRVDFADVVYFAHWITPVAEPRRYDTRFFAARLPEQREVRADPREMTDALWLAPAEALARFAQGALPMVFPTVRTLEQLADFQTTAAALAALRERDVEPILPRLVRTETGVGIVIDPK
jgi:8-oxo-dGTP pyrophosphatase MutT (NUDIX family)